MQAAGIDLLRLGKEAIKLEEDERISKQGRKKIKSDFVQQKGELQF